MRKNRRIPTLKTYLNLAETLSHLLKTGSTTNSEVSSSGVFLISLPLGHVLQPLKQLCLACMFHIYYFLFCVLTYSVKPFAIPATTVLLSFARPVYIQMYNKYFNSYSVHNKIKLHVSLFKVFRFLFTLIHY